MKMLAWSGARRGVVLIVTALLLTPVSAALAAGKAGPEAARAFLDELRAIAPRWRAVGVQLGDISWGMELDLSGRTPKVRYPDLGCEGHWEVLGKAPGGPLVIIEQIDNGLKECLDGGVAFLEEIDGTMLRYRWLDGDGEAVAKAVLVPGRFSPDLADALYDLTLEHVDRSFLSLAETRGLVPYRTP